MKEFCQKLTLQQQWLHRRKFGGVLSKTDFTVVVATLYSVFHVALTDFERKFHNLWLIANSIANVFQVQYEGTFDTQMEFLEYITPYLYSTGISQESQSPSIQIPLSGRSIDISKSTSLHLICQIFHTYQLYILCDY